ncbi:MULTISPECIES: hypothetical protein [Halorussus]|nr:hypothetical protein [Halorussus vallis]USZ78662.1 hypothetical protein NGM07_24440 [Halorussus vallis]
MSNSKTYVKKFVALAIAALLVTGGMQGALAAKPSIDTETTNTTSTSEITDGSVIDVRNGANASDYHSIQYTADSENSKLKVTLNGSKEGDAVFYANSSAEVVDSASNTYKVNFSEVELADVPRKVNQNVTLDFTIINNTAAANSDTTTIQVTLRNGANNSVVYVSDFDVEDSNDIETFNKNTTIAGLTIPFTTKDYSQISDLDRNVNGSATDVTVVFGNGTVAEDYSNAVASDASEGDWLISQASLLSTTPVKVYNEEAPDSVSDGDSYGVYSSDIGGQAGITYELGETFEDEDEVTVNSFGNKNYGFSYSLLKSFGALDAIKAASF